MGANANGVIAKNRKAFGYDYADLAQILVYVTGTLHYEVRQTVTYELPQFPYGCVETSFRLPNEPWSEWLAPTPVLVGDETEGGNQKRKNTLAQRYGSAQTYARRYSLNTALCLAATDDDAQSSGYQRRSIPFMTDEQKRTVDRILGELGVPAGQENNQLSQVLGYPVAYATLTEFQAQQFITAYNARFNNNSEEGGR